MLLPSGRSIQAKGITPDIIVEEPGASTQARLREADLTRHLVNPRDKQAVEKAEKEAAEAADRAAAAAKSKPSTQDDPAKKPIELGSKDDFQLMQALAHLKGEPVKGQPPKTIAAETKAPGG